MRKDITEKTDDDGTVYSYSEALMTENEYQNYFGQLLSQAGTNDNQTIIMSAMADITDMILSMQS